MTVGEAADLGVPDLKKFLSFTGSLPTASLKSKDKR